MYFPRRGSVVRSLIAQSYLDHEMDVQKKEKLWSILKRLAMNV